jgi:hypothetical protein
VHVYAFGRESVPAPEQAETVAARNPQ